MQLLRVGKHHGAEFFPVDVAAGIEDLIPKAFEDFLIGGAAGLDQLVPDAVGVDDVRAQVLEVSRHGAFSAGDASGEAKGKSEAPKSEVRSQVPASGTPRKAVASGSN